MVCTGLSSRSADFLEALRTAIRAKGGRFLEGECAEFNRQGDRLTGIRTTADETLNAEHVIHRWRMDTRAHAST